MLDNLTHSHLIGLIEENYHVSDKDKTQKFYDDLYIIILNFITEPYKIPLNTLFSQVSFIGSIPEFPSKILQMLHFYRLKIIQEKCDETENISKLDLLKIRVGIITQTIDYVFNEKSIAFIEEKIYCNRHINFRKEKYQFYQSIRFLISAFHEDGNFEGIDSSNPIITTIVRFDPLHNEAQIKQLQLILPILTLPVEVNLLQVKVSNDVYFPEMVIFFPDHLVDVTAVSECFLQYGYRPDIHIVKRFVPKQNSKSLFIGILSNYFLDELLFNHSITFEIIKNKIFKIDALFLALQNDNEISAILQIAKIHFDHIKTCVNETFQKFNISREHISIEPSFYSVKHGLQGRLDLLAFDKKSKMIVELKSGKPFAANKYGVSASHYIQTLLYDLLLKGETTKTHEIKSFILYSVLEQSQLKFAPVAKSEQNRAILVRNQIMLLDYRISLIDANGNDATQIFNVLEKLAGESFSGFIMNDIATINDAYLQLTEVEKKYFRAQSGFLMREFFISKQGNIDQFRNHSQSSLWLQNFKQKSENHSILAFLKVINVEEFQQKSIVSLQKNGQTDPLSDFRVGDIVVLYQSDVEGTFIWQGAQIFKGTIISLSDIIIEVKLRSTQINPEIFKSHENWNLEKDVMDSSFSNQFKSFGLFLQCPPRKRALLLGQIAPKLPQVSINLQHIEVPAYHRNILQKIVSCEDYFLLWGPPGSGKTHFMIKNLIPILYQTSQKPLLIISYTNRAVDELCEAIHELGAEFSQSYLRISSSANADTRFANRLLDHQLEFCKNRSELIHLLNSQKIIIGTVASLSGKIDLFKLLSFEWALVDESSQILDSHIIGMLIYVKKFVLIGDHKQLPAVITQRPDQVAVTELELNKIGIKSWANSLFERLYKQASENNWNWAYDVLVLQGRMNRNIMEFPSKAFYNNKLDVLFEKQNINELFSCQNSKGKSGYKSELSSKRSLFIDLKESKNQFSKMSNDEAALICKLIEDIADLFLNDNKKIENYSIGIITPFRAQIVNIQRYIGQLKFHLNIVIDTVERFQGGAKDIVFISTVISHPTQLNMITSPNDDGIDRKLNVALTRAREMLIMVGQKNVLKANTTYKEFINQYGVIE